MNVKQVIVLRTRYPDGNGGTRKVRAGKLIAQACHASMKVFFDLGHVNMMAGPDSEDEPEDVLIVSLTESMREWVEGIFTKVVVGVETEEGLLQVYQQAQDAGIPCALITDVGNTEFKAECSACMGLGILYEHLDKNDELIDPPKMVECPICKGIGKVNVPTHTAVAIGPAEAEDIDKITGHLSLL